MKLVELQREADPYFAFIRENLADLVVAERETEAEVLRTAYRVWRRRLPGRLIPPPLRARAFGRLGHRFAREFRETWVEWRKVWAPPREIAFPHRVGLLSGSVRVPEIPAEAIRRFAAQYSARPLPEPVRISRYRAQRARRTSQSQGGR